MRASSSAWSTLGTNGVGGAESSSFVREHSFPSSGIKPQILASSHFSFSAKNAEDGRLLLPQIAQASQTAAQTNVILTENQSTLMLVRFYVKLSHCFELNYLKI